MIYFQFFTLLHPHKNEDIAVLSKKIQLFFFKRVLLLLTSITFQDDVSIMKKTKLRFPFTDGTFYQLERSCDLPQTDLSKTQKKYRIKVLSPITSLSERTQCTNITTTHTSEDSIEFCGKRAYKNLLKIKSLMTFSMLNQDIRCTVVNSNYLYPPYFKKPHNPLR